MTEEDRKRNFSILVELVLYEHLQLISESTVKNKGELAAKQIAQFYEEYKEQFNLKNIKEVEDELEKVKKSVAKARGIER